VGGKFPCGSKEKREILPFQEVGPCSKGGTSGWKRRLQRIGPATSARGKEKKKGERLSPPLSRGEGAFVLPQGEATSRPPKKEGGRCFVLQPVGG